MVRSNYKTKFRSKRRFKPHGSVDDEICQELLEGVWGIEWVYQPYYDKTPPRPYMEHLANCVVAANNDPDLELEDHKVVIKLAEIIDANYSESIQHVFTYLQAHYPGSTPGTQLAAYQLEQALAFALRLRIYISPNLTDMTQTLQTVVNACLPPRTDPTKITGRLPHDFCAKHLWRKVGIDLGWTDDLSKHLTFEQSTIRVFRGSGMLTAIQHGKKSDPFPPEFIAETLRTMDLLFRPYEPRKKRWKKRYISKHEEIDLELAEAGWVVFSLDQYPFWYERLKVIQDVYKEREPNGLAQSYYDRRKRVQYATFWVAFVVFVLTVVFGIISSVTGIMQVYIAYRTSN